MSCTDDMDSRKSDTQQIQLFHNKWLERLTQISFAGFAAIWSVVLIVVIWAAWGTASPAMSALLFSCGLGCWVAFEYVMHRKLFHWKGRSAAVKKFVFMMHGNHHESPSDSLRNMMPPIVSLPFGAALWVVCIMVLDAAGTWAFSGFAVGYVSYDVTHFACHQWPMKSRIGKMLKHHHMRHHFVDEDANFAVTALFLDRLFGTRIATPRLPD